MARKKLATSWTQSDRDKYRRENPKSNLKDPQPEGGSRKDSYCARSAGIKKCKNPDKNGDCPNDIARRKWKCSGTKKKGSKLKNRKTRRRNKK